MFICFHRFVNIFLFVTLNCCALFSFTSFIQPSFNHHCSYLSIIVYYFIQCLSCILLFCGLVNRRHTLSGTCWCFHCLTIIAYLPYFTLLFPFCDRLHVCLVNVNGFINLHTYTIVGKCSPVSLSDDVLLPHCEYRSQRPTCPVCTATTIIITDQFLSLFNLHVFYGNIP